MNDSNIDEFNNKLNDKVNNNLELELISDSKYEILAAKFKFMDNATLMTTRDNFSKKPGWTTSRALFYSALRSEFEKRGLDYDKT